MPSWGVWILFFKFLWGNVFLKNHGKSVGYQVVIWSQNLRFSYFSFGLIFRRISFFKSDCGYPCCLLPYILASGSSAIALSGPKGLTERASASLMGSDGMGWTRTVHQKGPSIFFIFCGCIDYVYIYLYR